MIKLKKINFKEEKLKLLASIGNNDMKHKWKIIKSITHADSNKEDPVKEIDLKRIKRKRTIKVKNISILSVI